jgi:hypothetical protein
MVVSLQVSRRTWLRVLSSKVGALRLGLGTDLCFTDKIFFLLPRRLLSMAEIQAFDVYIKSKFTLSKECCLIQELLDTQNSL